MKRLFNILLLSVCSVLLLSCVNNGKMVDAADNTPSEDKGVLSINVGTRTNGSAARDYILCIYKVDGEKSTLVRKYDSSKEDMQKPEYIWLLAGSYLATVECGTPVATTFKESEQYLYGESKFNITAGETSTVDVVAVLQNIPVEVIFDQSIIDGFHEGYNVEVKADDNTKLSYTTSKKGFFIMPEGCTTLTWRFVGTFEYKDNGELVNIDKSGTIENVEAKRAYKLSFKFSADASGLLGGLSVVVDETIEERDDHIGFNPDPELKGVGFDIAAVCDYAGGERKYVATSPADFCAVSVIANGQEYNPVDNTVAGITLTGLNTPQLYVTLSDDFFNTLPGGSHNIELCVTDTSGGEARKDLPYNLQGVNSYNGSNADLWFGTATLSATVFNAPTSVEIIYREGEGEWNHFAATSSGSKTYSAQVEGIGAGRTYEYNLVIDGKTVGTSLSFSTSGGNQIPNGGMEDWCKDGKANVPYHTASNPFWSTGNKGTTVLSADDNLTSSSSDARLGSSGTTSARLQSKTVMGIFGAGNVFVGSFGKVDIGSMSAIIYFGQPFDYNAKPKGLKLWVKYNCGTIDNVKSGSGVNSGDPDLAKIFCCMCNWSSNWKVDSSNADATTFSPSLDNVVNNNDGRYNGVLYTAYFESSTSNNEWHELYIPFEKVIGADHSAKANYMVFTITCSGYGDYLTGSTGSWMHVDDIELVY